MNELLRELACFGCPYNDDCDDGWEEGHSHCDEMMVRAKSFAERTGIVNGWISAKVCLPDEPKSDAEMKEYNVTIVGALESTTLTYVGNGEWHDKSDNRYNVLAWQPLPEPYK